MSQNKKLEWIIKSLFVLTFFVPLIVGSKTFIFPFIVPKIIVFRSLALTLAGVYVILLVSAWKTYRPRWSPVTLMVSLFLLSATLSTFFGADWYHSFWDRHERMLGLFTIIHYVVYYLIMTAVVRERQDWLRLGQIFAASAAIVMGLGIMQKINPSFLLNNGSERVSATLGNSIYLGGYGLFLFFLSLLLVFWEKQTWLKVALYGSAVLGIIGVIISGTRGSLLGLLFGLGTMLALYTVTLSRDHRRARSALLTALCGLVILLLGLFLFRTRPFVANLPTIGKLLNTSFTQGTASTRLMAWSIAVEGWRARPFLGWGPNNYIYVFNKYYRPQFLQQGWGETWFDNAHNIIVNTLATQGVLGVTVYLGLFTVTIGWLVRSYRAGRVDRHLFAIGVAFLGAHLIQNVFVFENPTSYLYFMFWLALCNSLLSAPTRPVELGRESESSRPRFFPTILVSTGLAVTLIFILNINPARANMAMLMTLRKLYTGQEPITQYQKTVAIWSPHIDDIRNDFARAATTAASEYFRQGRTLEAKAMLLLAHAELDKNIKLHPLDLRVYLQQGQTAQIAFELFQDKDILQQTRATLEYSLRLSPKRQQLHYILASTRFLLSDVDGATTLLRESIEYDPVISEGWWRLAFMYEQSNQLEKAKSVIREARQRGVVFTLDGLNIANRILAPEAT